MSERNDILRFAEKWLPLWREHTLEASAFRDDFGEECEAFGWLMDMGELFQESTGCRLYDSAMLSELWDNLRSTDTVGSALYSSWRAFTHWMETSQEEPRVRVWFIALLERLRELAGGKRQKDSITLPPEKLQLITFTRLSLPDMPDDDVEQHITINSKGMAYVSVFCRDENFGKEQIAKKTMGIGKARAHEILEAFASVFSFTDVSDSVSYDASWALVLTDRNGDKFKYASSMVPYGIVSLLTPLSEDIRTMLGDHSLMVLDGECGKDSIENIEVEYRNGDDGTREVLTLDREFETLVYEKTAGTGFRMKREWRVGDEVSVMLDEMYDEKIFRDRPGRPTDLVDRSYTVDIRYRKRGDVTYRGVYDMDGLPKSYPLFAEKIARFLDTYAPGEDLLDRSLYSRRKRGEGEFMVCSVQFRKDSPTYYYLSTDDSLSEGDLVEVQCTGTELTNTGMIRRIELFRKEDSPVDIEKAKWIVRRAGTLGR